MKKMLILTFALLVMASLVGCQRCSLFRGSRLFGGQQAAVVETCPETCVISSPCEEAVSTGCSSCGTGGAVVAPGPEAYGG